jgi:hypothetical protein
MVQLFEKVAMTMFGIFDFQTIVKPATLHVSESGVGLLTHNR